MKLAVRLSLLAALALPLAACREEPSPTRNEPAAAPAGADESGTSRSDSGSGRAPRESAAAENHPATTTENVFLDLSLDAALEKARAQDKLVMVDFYATWCPPCKMLDSTTWRHQGVVAWLRQHTIPIKIDTDKHGRLAAKHRIEGLPTLVFLKPDGTETGRLVGYLPPKQFLDAAPNAIR